MSHPSRHDALDTYRSVGAYGAAAAQDRLQLILRLMQGALDRIATARGHMERQQTGPKGDEIGRAIMIIDGLRSCLDVEQGGEIAGNLEALYDYMTRRLLEANVGNHLQMLDEVAELLGEIKDGWQQMAANPPQVPGAAG